LKIKNSPYLLITLNSFIVSPPLGKSAFTKTPPGAVFMAWSGGKMTADVTPEEQDGTKNGENRSEMPSITSEIN
jgi:hypothetical protein